LDVRTLISMIHSPGSGHSATASKRPGPVWDSCRSSGPISLAGREICTTGEVTGSIGRPSASRRVRSRELTGREPDDGLAGTQAGREGRLLLPGAWPRSRPGSG
jgi:hypothetical protein